ncbi:uncharacterized protein K441DRAFT_662591 [Cenococcum geophilum 1.58]|uniref:uncharacterized protein n=1 Tax=Cenococcum geophilum 1.58 TaxID=794803 RepID=UPI00358EC832|nr:hypothetical protein K441DRAFT_662591 [Cenococcum geophilum 1.58]
MPLLGARSQHPQPSSNAAPGYNVVEREEQSTAPPDPPDSQGTTSRPRASSAGQPSTNRNASQMNGHTPSMEQNVSNGASAGRPLMLRAKSDFGSRREDAADSADEDIGSSADGDFKIRHGWESQLTSEEYNNLLTSTFFMYYTDKKHETGGNPKEEDEAYALQEWRMRDRLKTVSAVLALCLNIGVDPPDVIKTNPCAKEECWIDPSNSAGASGHTPMNQIGKALQTQYEQLSMRTRYKLCLDPTVDETRRYCTTLRRNARNERVLFHYNGHGVPKPTSSGEIWVFNRNYTQYIPISLYDLQSWIGAPSLFVYDCSDAGLIISNFNKFAEKHESENIEARRRDPHVEVMDFSDCIHLAACREKETLPTNPELPADVFTSCLTDPIIMAVRFFILQNPLPSTISTHDASNIPGRVSERRTPIGELNWIFTAITDTIAWNSLSKPLFKRLFRQDLMVAALFRNFLLAQRNMTIRSGAAGILLSILDRVPLNKGSRNNCPLCSNHARLTFSRIMDTNTSLVFLTRAQVFISKQSYLYHANDLSSGIPILNASEHRAMCAFIVAMFCKDYHQGQVVSLSPELIESCLDHLRDLQNPLLRQWSCLCLSKLWVNFPDAKWVGIRCLAHQRLCELVLDPVAEVRAAMLYALTTFLGIPDVTAQVAHIEESIASMVLIMTTDGNSMVRKELLVFFSTFIVRYKSRFVVAAFEQFAEESSLRDDLSSRIAEKNGDGFYMKMRTSSINNGEPSSSCSQNTVFSAMWKEMLIMSVDPHPEIARDAGIVVDYVLIALLDSPLAKFAQPQLEEISKHSRRPRPSRSVHELPLDSQASLPPTPSKPDGYLSMFGIRRTASVAASLKSLSLFGGHDSSPNFNKSPARSRVPSEFHRPPDEKDQPQTPPASYNPADEPKPRGFSPRDLGEEPKLPLKSKFYEWSVEYFREPQMKPSEADEPGSTDYNGRLWRRNRNDKIIAETQPQKDLAGSNRWDKPKGSSNNGSQPMKMCFHQFEDHLIVTDNRDTVCVWDWERQTRLNRFSNGNPQDSKITEVRLINEDDQALLMTGSSDGVVKLFRNYESKKKVELVTSFRALTDLVPSNKNAGLVFDWQQGRGLILVAGDVKVIRVWNAGTEICTSDIPARSGSCITSLTSDQVEGDVFIAGFGDGAVRVYDQREKPATAMVKVWKEHKQWITNVHLQRGGQRELVSGCRSGEVKLWDIRLDRSVKTIRATKDTLRSLSVHEHAPVFATGSERHTVKIFNLNNGVHLSSFEPYSSFLHQSRSSPIATTAFHPHRMMIAGAALHDTHINIFTCQDGQVVKQWEPSTQ